MGALTQAWLQTSWATRRAARRFTWRFGPLGWIALACSVLALPSGLYAYLSTAELARLRQESSMPRPAVVRPAAAEDGATKSDLRAFENILLDHDDIPSVVGRLLELADEQHLLIASGEYKPQPDLQGRFVRYRIVFPVKGNPESIHRFLQAALHDHRMLALEAVQFKREHIHSTEIEARIQWTLLSRPPAQEATEVAGNLGKAAQ